MRADDGYASWAQAHTDIYILRNTYMSSFPCEYIIRMHGQPLHIYTHMRICVFLGKFLYVHAWCTKKYTCVPRVQNTYIHIYIHICVPIYTHMVHRILHICLYVYMYTHMCTYIGTCNVPIYAHACLLMHRYRIYIYDTHTYML